MEHALSWDFSQIRIFPNSAVAASYGAQACAVGDELHFASGRYEPAEHSGLALIGHELAHVVQQRQGRVPATGELNGALVNDSPALEREADQAGEQAARGQAPPARSALARATPKRAMPGAQGSVAQLKKEEPPPRYDRETREDQEDQRAFMSTMKPGLGHAIIRRIQSKAQVRQSDSLFLGIECNASAVMYMLQSYGLIPPDMRLEEFEEAFTPVDIEKFFKRMKPAESARDPAKNIIRVNGKEQQTESGQPIHGVDMFTPILHQILGSDIGDTNRRARGGFHTQQSPRQSDGIIPDRGDTALGPIILQMTLIAFKELGNIPKYSFLRKSKYFTNSLGERANQEYESALASGADPKDSADALARERKRADDPKTLRTYFHSSQKSSSLIDGDTTVVSLSSELSGPGIPRSYFAKGHTIYAGINEENKQNKISHYVLVTNYVKERQLGGKSHHIYEADDPFYGAIYVLAPGATWNDYRKESGRGFRSTDGQTVEYSPQRDTGSAGPVVKEVGARSKAGWRPIFLFANLALGVADKTLRDGTSLPPLRT